MTPIHGNIHYPSLAVKELPRAFPELNLSVLAGKGGLDNTIEHPRIQKPGLALTGIRDYIHPGRVQVFGKAEMSYLNNLPPPMARTCMENFLVLGVSCIVVTKALEIPKAVRMATEQANVPLLRSDKQSSTVIEVFIDKFHDLLAPRLGVHGVLMDVFGVGVLILGEHSTGKSECALDLVTRGHRLVADDMVVLRQVAHEIMGNAPENLYGLMEIRGLGIISIKDLFGVASTRREKRVDMAVELEPWKEGAEYDRVGENWNDIEILGLSLPSVLIPVAPGRNVTMLLEVAARNLMLKRKGIVPSFPGPPSA